MSHTGPTSRSARTEEQKELKVREFHRVPHPWVWGFFGFPPLSVAKHRQRGGLIHDGSRSSVVVGLLTASPLQTSRRAEPSSGAAREMLRPPESSNSPQRKSCSAPPFPNSHQPRICIPDSHAAVAAGAVIPHRLPDAALRFVLDQRCFQPGARD